MQRCGSGAVGLRCNRWRAGRMGLSPLACLGDCNGRDNPRRRRRCHSKKPKARSRADRKRSHAAKQHAHVPLEHQTYTFPSHFGAKAPGLCMRLIGCAKRSCCSLGKPGRERCGGLCLTEFCTRAPTEATARVRLPSLQIVESCGRLCDRRAAHSRGRGDANGFCVPVLACSFPVILYRRTRTRGARLPRCERVLLWLAAGFAREVWRGSAEKEPASRRTIT